MNELDFTLELNSEDLPDNMDDELYAEAETRLNKLANGNTDMIGAAINIRRPVHGVVTPLYEVTVVVYSRPDHVAATQKEDDPQLALKGALSAVERQIRERRKKLKKPWERPGNKPLEQEIIETLAAEEDITDID